MERVFSKLSKYGALGLVCLSLAACSQAGNKDPQTASAPQVSAVESALEDPVAQCQEEQRTCLGAAMDRAAAVQCSAAFRECLGGAVETGQQLAAALQECRDKAVACGVQGGATGAGACRDEYEACVSAVSSDGSQPPAADAGMPEEPPPPAAGDGAPQAPSAGGPAIPRRPGLPGRRPPFAGAGGLGGFPTRPGLPRLPSAGSISFPSAGGRGGLPGRPGSEASACFEALRMCLETQGSDLDKCATEARACVRNGGPQGAAGAGGAAGAP